MEDSKLIALIDSINSHHRSHHVRDFIAVFSCSAKQVMKAATQGGLGSMKGIPKRSVDASAPATGKSVLERWFVKAGEDPTPAYVRPANSTKFDSKGDSDDDTPVRIKNGNGTPSAGQSEPVASAGKSEKASKKEEKKAAKKAAKKEAKKEAKKAAKEAAKKDKKDKKAKADVSSDSSEEETAVLAVAEEIENDLGPATDDDVEQGDEVETKSVMKEKSARKQKKSQKIKSEKPSTATTESAAAPDTAVTDDAKPKKEKKVKKDKKKRRKEESEVECGDVQPLEAGCVDSEGEEKPAKRKRSKKSKKE